MAGPTLVVMAAGVGSRFGGLKQIEPIGPNGEITVAYSVYDALRAGFERVVFIIRHDMETPFRERIGQFVEKQVRTDYVFQELDMLPPGFVKPSERTKPWGTGHAILRCRDTVREPFAVINADDFYGAQAYRELAGFLRRDGAPTDYSMVGFVLKNTLSDHGTVARGVCNVGPDGFLRDIAERTQIGPKDGVIKYAEGDRWVEVSGAAPVSMNMWGFRPSIFDELAPRFESFLRGNLGQLKSEFYIPVVVGELLREGRARVKVLKTEDAWYGVTFREDLPEVRAAIEGLVKQGKYPPALWR
jgi:dTDP-glucose pyrophosphorylase